MNSSITKYGAASVGAVALFATALSLGGGGDLPKAGDASRLAESERAVSPLPRHLSRSFADAHPAARSRLVDDVETFLLTTSGHGVRWAMVTMNPSNESPDSPESSPTAPGAKSVTVTIPREVTVTLPEYEGGRDPWVTPPAYRPGTHPSVEQDGRRVVIDPGESGTWTAPTVDPGEPGAVTPPRLTIE